MAQSVNQSVWKIIESDAALRRDLSRDVINIRALARWMIKRYDIFSSPDAVISAIRRFSKNSKFEESDKAAIKIFKRSQITTKNNIVCLTVSDRGGALFERLVGFDKPFKMMIGDENSKIITARQCLDEIQILIPKKIIVNVEKNLGEISMILSAEAQSTPGILAHMSAELALSDVNIYEIIVCLPEISLYVSEKNIVKAHDSILKLAE
jgi:aspartokinase